MEISNNLNVIWAFHKCAWKFPRKIDCEISANCLGVCLGLEESRSNSWKYPNTQGDSEISLEKKCGVSSFNSAAY
jgi:hypothetical protein